MLVVESYIVVGMCMNISSSSLLSSTSSGDQSQLSKVTSGPSPLMSSPQSSVPGSIGFFLFFGLMPASLSFFSLSFCRSRASVGYVMLVLEFSECPKNFRLIFGTRVFCKCGAYCKFECKYRASVGRAVVLLLATSVTKGG